MKTQIFKDFPLIVQRQLSSWFIGKDFHFFALTSSTVIRDDGEIILIVIITYTLK